MRPYLLSLAFLLCMTTAAAQVYPASDEQVFVYANTGFALGSPSGLRFSLATLFASHHEISVGYNYYAKKSRETPSDYLENQGWNLGFTSTFPQDDWSGLAITYGYVLYPRGLPKHRCVLRAGVLAGTLTTPDEFTPRYSGFNLFGPKNPAPTPGYYSYTRTGRNGYAFLLQPSIDYSPSRAFGLSLGAYAIFSDGMNGGGITASMLFGKVSNMRRPMSQRAHERRKQRSMRRAKQWAM